MILKRSNMIFKSTIWFVLIQTRRAWAALYTQLIGPSCDSSFLQVLEGAHCMACFGWISFHSWHSIQEQIFALSCVSVRDTLSLFLPSFAGCRLALRLLLWAVHALLPDQTTCLWCHHSQCRPKAFRSQLHGSVLDEIGLDGLVQAPTEKWCHHICLRGRKCDIEGTMSWTVTCILSMNCVWAMKMPSCMSYSLILLKRLIWIQVGIWFGVSSCSTSCTPCPIKKERCDAWIGRVRKEKMKTPKLQLPASQHVDRFLQERSCEPQKQDAHTGRFILQDILHTFSLLRSG